MCRTGVRRWHGRIARREVNWGKSENVRCAKGRVPLVWWCCNAARVRIEATGLQPAARAVFVFPRGGTNVERPAVKEAAARNHTNAPNEHECVALDFPPFACMGETAKREDGAQTFDFDGKIREM